MNEIPVPNYPNYFVTETGEIISYARGKRRVKAWKNVAREHAQPRHQVVLHNEDGSYSAMVSRTVMAAVLGRWPLPWEQVRHMDTNASNNSISNLKIGCPVLNLLDDIENGTRQTSAEYIDEAIERLLCLKAQYQSG
jgi:hypothetical protein